MKRIILLAAVLTVATTSSAWADIHNTRPVSPANNSLQTALNGITTAGPQIDVNNDQSDWAVFTNQAGAGAVATFLIATGTKADTNRFGLYDYTTGTKAQVFSGVTAGPAQALISIMANGDVWLNGVGTGTKVATGFGTAFGFYLDVYELDADSTTLDATWYTEDSRNGGEAHALAYQGNNQTKLTPPGGFAEGTFTDNHWIFAWEQGALHNSDKDYDDLVVLVESIQPVPVPGAALLVGLGLGLLGWLKRRIA